MKKPLLLFSFLFLILTSFSATEEVKKDSIKYTIAPDDAVLVMIDSVLADKYYNAFGFCMDTLGNLPADSTPPQVDSIIERRVNELNQATPFDLRYNQYTKAFINLYVKKKKKLSSSVLSLAPLYFPMIEEVLDRYNMPLELKYLAVVESALNPAARSRVGAQGLWQFMYGTGKMYDLQVSSYKDDRMDPYKSTVAACEYMSDLYKMYGDWNLVLAAYNSGPGNVNKAIRRSGGKKDYWQIRAWLPRETRGYVPAFIAVNYMMNYAEEHNIYAENNQLFSYQVDTIQIDQAIDFSQLSNYLNISKEELVFYNPMYKLAYIPKNKKKQTLVLPIDKIGTYLTNEKSIYADIRRTEIADSIAGKKKREIVPDMLVHRVRSGEFLGYIANKYHVSVRDLMAWNNLRSTRLNPGDRLKVYSKNARPTASNKTKRTIVTKPETRQKGKYKVHIVKSGDTLWDIAKKYNNTSVNELKRLNSTLNFKRLKPGMEVKIKAIG